MGHDGLAVGHKVQVHGGEEQHGGEERHGGEEQHGGEQRRGGEERHGAQVLVLRDRIEEQQGLH